MPFSLDLELLRRYWVDRPAVYHHTTPILGVYALHEALRRVLEEGSRTAGRATPPPPRTCRPRCASAASSCSPIRAASCRR